MAVSGQLQSSMSYPNAINYSKWKRAGWQAYGPLAASLASVRAHHPPLSSGLSLLCRNGVHVLATKTRCLPAPQECEVKGHVRHGPVSPRKRRVREQG